MQRLGANPESLKRLEYVFAENAGEACYKCSVQREEWQKIAERERDGVPVFSTYI